LPSQSSPRTADQHAAESSDTSFRESIAFSDGRWIRRCDLSLSVDDLGFRQGVTAVERLRTYGGKIWQSARHAQRFGFTLSEIDLKPWSNQYWDDLIYQLLQRNANLIARSDVSLVVLSTPGLSIGEEPTVIAMIQPLDHALNRTRQTEGQSIVITDVVQPPDASWSRQAKVRCRLHYYRADRQASGRSPGSTGLLIDRDGSVTETSIANIAIVKDETIYSPLPESILSGVTQSVAQDIAQSLNWAWSHTRLMPSDLYEADEVWLMGTDNGVWFSGNVDGHIIASGKAGRLLHQLQNEFAKLTGSSVTS
jgi:branched-chain amino acid aminotransferase